MINPVVAFNVINSTVGISLSLIIMFLILPRKYSLRFSISVMVLSVVAVISALLVLRTTVTESPFILISGGVLWLPVVVWLSRGQFFQKTFVFFLTFLFVVLLNSFSFAILDIAIGFANEYFSVLQLAVNNLLIVSYFILVLKFGRRIFQKLFIDGRKAEWALYSFGVVFSWLSVTLLRDLTDNAFVHILAIVFVAWSFIMLCYAIINTHEKAKQRYEAELKEREFAEEKALLENLNRTKSEFYGNISHEMKTPLTVIATDIQVAERNINEGNLSEAKELMRDALQETMQAANLVTDALLFARGQEISKPMELFDLAVVIDSTLNIFAPLIKKHGNTLKRDIAETAPVVGNANMLADALVNLLINANRHTDNGIISVKLRNENGEARISVSDNGSGIPEEILPRIFERGVTGGPGSGLSGGSGASGGTGIGLALVKIAVQRHGGEVSIESTEGKGTTVTLAFPVSAEESV